MGIYKKDSGARWIYFLKIDYDKEKTRTTCQAAYSIELCDMDELLRGQSQVQFHPWRTKGANAPHRLRRL